MDASLFVAGLAFVWVLRATLWFLAALRGSSAHRPDAWSDDDEVWSS